MPKLKELVKIEDVRGLTIYVYGKFDPIGSKYDFEVRMPWPIKMRSDSKCTLMGYMPINLPQSGSTYRIDSIRADLLPSA